MRSYRVLTDPFRIDYASCIAVAIDNNLLVFFEGEVVINGRVVVVDPHTFLICHAEIIHSGQGRAIDHAALAQIKTLRFPW